MIRFFHQGPCANQLLRMFSIVDKTSLENFGRGAICKAVVVICYDFDKHHWEISAWWPSGQQIAKIEKELWEVGGYEDFCLIDEDTGDCVSIESPIDEIFGDNITTQGEINDALVGAWNKGVRKYFAKELNPDNNQLKSFLTKTTVKLGWPLSGFKNPDDRLEEQQVKLRDWLWKPGGWAEILLNMMVLRGCGFWVDKIK